MKLVSPFLLLNKRSYTYIWILILFYPYHWCYLYIYCAEGHVKRNYPLNQQRLFHYF